MTCEVLIVGAGPVGLTLAGLLGRRGIDTVIVEREEDVFALPRAAHIDHTGLRTMQELGCLDEMLPMMISNAGLVLADSDLAPLTTLPGDQGSISGLPASMYFYQPDFDRVLEACVTDFDTVRVLRGIEMLDLEQEPERVTVRVRDVASGAGAVVRARIVVGCDGSTSRVRDALGIDLESLDFDERWLVLDLKPQMQELEVPHCAMQVCDPRRPWVSNPMPGGRYRIELRLFDDETSAEVDALRTPENISAHLEPLLGRKVDFDITRRAVYTFHGLVAASWRSGRVLLAGDAAHQMPPFLGQGMCSGIRDAENLAWKIALVLADRQRLSFLDSYEAERSPHVRDVVRSAVEIGKFVSVSDDDEVEARNASLRADGMAGAPRFSLPRLLEGPLISRSGGRLFPQTITADGSRLDDVIGLHTTILTTDPDIASADVAPWVRALDARVVAVDDLAGHAADLRAWFGRHGCRFAVVRPDRYIMATGCSLDELRQAAPTAGRGGPMVERRAHA